MPLPRPPKANIYKYTLSFSYSLCLLGLCFVILLKQEEASVFQRMQVCRVFTVRPMQTALISTIFVHSPFDSSRLRFDPSPILTIEPLISILLHTISLPSSKSYKWTILTKLPIFSIHYSHLGCITLKSQ